MRQRLFIFLMSVLLAALTGCNLMNSGSNKSSVKVAVTPATATVSQGTTQQFTAAVTGATDMSVTWEVNNTAGGNSTVGTITNSGVYTPPATLPNPATITVTATSVADSRASGSASVTVQKPATPITVQVSPASVTVPVGTMQQFTATVSGTKITQVSWSVNGVAGGNSTVGTISTSGLYTPPATQPNPANVMVMATSAVDATAKGNSAVTVAPKVVVTVTVSPQAVDIAQGGTQQFTATVTGTSNTDVYWEVDGVPGGNATSGTITTAGLYSAPLAVPATSVTVQAFSRAQSGASGGVRFTVKAATQQVGDAAAARFLEQASWGPNDDSIARVKLSGFSKWIDDQMTATSSTWTDLGPNDGIDVLQKQFFVNAMQGQDQLRQRVAFALGQVFVISTHKNDPHSFPPYVRLLNQDAFGNFKTLLKDVTLSPSMGYYLDMVNNDKPDPTRGINPNENYAREILQLFSVGTVMLNPDGSQQFDASNNPIPTYGQDVIQGFAHVFTGWTYPTQAGKTLQKHNPQYWSGPMEVFESNHDTGAKLVLSGVTLPAGQTSSQDLDAAMQNIFTHPNVGPFICMRLIEHLVTSNPSPDYMTRCSATFADNGSGVRGDMAAVVKEILLDAEALRGDDPTKIQANDGKMREPILFILGMLRGLNATTDGDNLNWYALNMRQDLFNPVTVFNYYPPDYKLVNSPLYGPEFKIYDSGTSMWRTNYVNTQVFWGYPNTTTIDYTTWKSLAADDNKLLDALSARFMHGSMPTQLRQAIIPALDALSPTDVDARAKTAIYLTLTSMHYTVQY